MSALNIYLKKSDARLSDFSSLPEEETLKGQTMLPDQGLAYLTGRLILRSKLGMLLGLEPSEIPLARHSTGRPYLKGILNGPEFSLSHTVFDGAIWVVVAISEAGLVGVDLERFDRHTDWRRIASRRFPTEEWTYLKSLDEGAGRQLFYQLWTLKEAMVKLEDGQLMSMLARPILEISDRAVSFVHNPLSLHSKLFPHDNLALGLVSQHTTQPRFIFD